MGKFVALLFTSLLLGLVGCDESDEHGREYNRSYPRIKYENSLSDYDLYDRCINIEAGYVLDDGHSYDIVETEKGYDIIFHFVEIKEKK